MRYEIGSKLSESSRRKVLKRLHENEFSFEVKLRRPFVLTMTAQQRQQYCSPTRIEPSHYLPNR